jgi:hypothetical protein
VKQRPINLFLPPHSIAVDQNETPLLEFSAVISWLEGAESDEGVEVFGRAEDVHSQAER